jgi:hypothetical protein
MAFRPWFLADERYRPLSLPVPATAELALHALSAEGEGFEPSTCLDDV